MNDETVLDLLSKYEKLLDPYGLEIKPFLIGWYNDLVDTNFHLNFSYNTLAINIINNSTMFEKIVLDFIRQSDVTLLESRQDLLDYSTDMVLNRVNLEISSDFLRDHKLFKTVIIRDYEMNNVTRQPKVVLQTAGHVSGQVRYYQRKDIPINKNPWDQSDKIYGCSLHHNYGGWFAFRGVIIFPGLEFSSLVYSEPPDPLHGNPELIIRLLNEFNLNWKSWSFRDLVDVKDRYSRAFMLYLSLPPGDERLELVRKWKAILMSRGDDCVYDELGEVSNEKIVLDWGMA